MWAGSVSHNGLTGCGSDGGDWVVHNIEHELSGLYDVAHGAGLAAVWGSWARFVYKENLSRFAQFARNVFHVTQADDEAAALEGIEAMEDFFRSVNMPTNLRALGVSPTEEEILLMAEKFSIFGKRTMGSMKKIGATEAAEIYRAAK